LASTLANSLGHPPEKRELEAPSEDALRMAKEIALRERHALHAADLALTVWQSSPTSESYHLIDNVELRNTYGRLIGEIAASHWWNIEEVAKKFPGTILGAPVMYPGGWNVDALKLACLMRCADAAHLDARRAPGFLRAVRKPSPYSDLHWKFQEYLQRARVEDDRMIFTSVRPFEHQDAQAWWVAFESIRMVDGELHKVDALLSDSGKERFRVRGVKGADSPTRLAEFLPTDGWTPIDAHVTVSNVAGLVRSLGGANLYGNDPSMALRELIQNARDANRALATILPAYSTPIEIILREKPDGWWLTVADHGIGMSQALITGPLMDFGRSYWGSNLMRRETPGLGSSGFSATGRYGIGFYSVFMLGEAVKVISRRYDEASADTRVLEFAEGLSARPILRPAQPGEIRLSGGTSVSVRLTTDPFAPGGLLRHRQGGVFDLPDLCGSLAPALDCDLNTQFNDNAAVTVVNADDWLTSPGETLLRRLNPNDESWSHGEVPIEQVAERMRPIVVDGKTIGRISLAPSPPVAVDADGTFINVRGAAVIGGLASSRLGGLAGVVQGTPEKADRTRAKLPIPADVWKEWATEQAVLWADYLNHRNYPYSERSMSVSLLMRLQADVGQIVVCHDRRKYLTADEVIEWATKRDHVIAVTDYSCDCKPGADGFSSWDQEDHRFFELHADLLRIENPGRYGEWGAYGDERPDKRYAPSQGARLDLANPFHWWYAEQLEISHRVLALIAEGWECPLEEVLTGLTNFGEMKTPVEIGKDTDGEPVCSYHTEWVATRPTSTRPTSSSSVA